MIITSIAARELRSLFLSPLAWVILAVIQVILAWLFLAQLDTYLTIQGRLAGIENAPGITDLVATPILGTAGLIMLLVTPMLTMRLLSEERRSGTLTLLMSAPISPTQIVIGKFLGIGAFMLITAGMIALMPFGLAFGTELDLGKLATGLLGLVLLLWTFSAIGLYLSSLTAQPAIAAISCFGLLLLLWVIDWAGNNRSDVTSLLSYVSTARHLESLLKGLFNSADVVFFLIMIGLFLTLTVRHLEAQRVS